MAWNKQRRQALWVQFAEYREKNGATPGKPLSLANVLQEMRESPDVSPAFFAGVAEKALNNRLWRFTVGKETQESTLDALGAFLSAQKTSSLGDLIGHDDEEMMAVYGLLANAGPLARKVFDAIVEGLYKPSPSLNQFGLELHFARHAEHMLMLVEEHWFNKDVRLNPADPMLPTRRGESVTIRTGYAFLTTEHHLLHVFLRGRHARDRVHYIQPSGLDSSGHPYLTRLGGLPLPEPKLPPAECQAILGLRQYKSAQPPAKRPEFWGDPTKPMGFRPPGTGESWGVFPLADLAPEEVTNRFLVSAVKQSSFDLTRFALREGGDPNWQDEEGWTALHHAASADARTAIRLLVASGKCDYLIRDNKGCYASDLAVLGGQDYGVARLLTKKRLEQAARLGLPGRV